MKTYKVEIDEYGNERWYNEEGKLHREGDKPAIIFSDGEQRWFQNDKLHREDDKPAVIYTNGDKEWWKDGKQVSEEEVKRLSTPSQPIENTIFEINNEKCKLVKV